MHASLAFHLFRLVERLFYSYVKYVVSRFLVYVKFKNLCRSHYVHHHRLHVGLPNQKL